jgi:hypothetical protein
MKMGRNSLLMAGVSKKIGFATGATSVSLQAVPWANADCSCRLKPRTSAVFRDLFIACLGNAMEGISTMREPLHRIWRWLDGNWPRGRSFNRNDAVELTAKHTKMGTKLSRAVAEAQALDGEAGFATRSGPSQPCRIGVSFGWSVCFVVQKSFPVAQTGSLLYRGLAIRRAGLARARPENFSLRLLASAPPTTSRRYSRLPTCATPLAASLRRSSG